MIGIIAILFGISGIFALCAFVCWIAEGMFEKRIATKLYKMFEIFSIIACIFIILLAFLCLCCIIFYGISRI